MSAVRAATPRAGPRGLANYYPPQTAGLRPSLFLPARDLLASARIRGGYGSAYVVVNRQVKGDLIVRRETDGEWATLRPTDRVVRTARSRIPNYMLPAMVRRTY